MAHDVFISYSHKDKAISDAICHHFENDKIKCWMAPRDIIVGENWAESIAAAISNSKVFLLVFSSSSNMSKQVLREVELAVSNVLIILPVRIEDIRPTGGMAYYLSTVHWIDVVNEDIEKKLHILSNTVSNILVSGEKPIIERQPIGVSPSFKNKSKASAWLWFMIASVVILAGVMLFVFRDSIFGGAPESLDASATMEITSAPTAEPTIAPTAEPTPKPTATVDPNVSLDMVVDIPDIVLKTCILKALDEMGSPIKGNMITVSDMRRLKSLTITSNPDEMYSFFGGNGFVDDNKLHVITMKFNISTLDGLQYASNLEYLSICDMGLEDISALSQIYKLKYLDLDFNNITDVSALSSMGNLLGLTIRGNDISDIKSLLLLYNINTLCISNNPINDLTPLSDMTQLTDLSITELNITNFDGLEDLTELRQILASHNPITDIEGIRNLKNLNFLELSNCEIENITPVESLESLEGISLMNTNVTDISSLAKLKRLKDVYIEDEKLAGNTETVEILTNQRCEFHDDD